MRAERRTARGPGKATGCRQEKQEARTGGEAGFPGVGVFVRQQIAESDAAQVVINEGALGDAAVVGLVVSQKCAT